MTRFALWQMWILSPRVLWTTAIAGPKGLTRAQSTVDIEGTFLREVMNM